MNKHLIMAANSKGFIVRDVKDGWETIFGPAHHVTVEGSQYRIEFLTNAIYGHHYFKIIRVQDLYKQRTYWAQRYHHKFISLIQEISTDTFLRIKAENKASQELKDEGIL